MTADEAHKTVCPLFAIARGSDAAHCLADRCQWWSQATPEAGRCAATVTASLFRLLFDNAPKDSAA